jgi:hypothetical protein
MATVFPLVEAESRHKKVTDGDSLAMPFSASASLKLVHGLLGSLTGADMNTTSDQSIHIAASQYVLDRIVVVGATASLTLAAGGIYTATGKGGSVIVAAGQLYSGLVASDDALQLTLAITTKRFAVTPIYLSLTVAQGTAATADFYIFGYRIV